MLYMLHLSWTPCICAGDPCLLRVHVGHRREDAGDQRVHPLDRWELDFYLNAGVWYKSQQVCELGTSCSWCTKLSPGPLFLVHCWRFAIYGKIFFRLISTSVHILHLTLLLFREDTKFPPRNLPDFRDGDDDRVSDNDRDGPELLLQRPSAYRGSSVGSQVRIFTFKCGSISCPNFEGKNGICKILYLTSNHCLSLSLTVRLILCRL